MYDRSFHIVLPIINITKANTKLANVPNKYLFLKLVSFKSFVLAQVLTVIIIAIAANSSKYENMIKHQ